MKAIRNRAMYEQVLGPVRQWLIANPTASARDAAKQFNIPANTIANKFRDEFDFTERRALRGTKYRERYPRSARAKTADLQVLNDKMDLIIKALAQLGLDCRGKKG